MEASRKGENEKTLAGPPLVILYFSLPLGCSNTLLFGSHSVQQLQAGCQSFKGLFVNPSSVAWQVASTIPFLQKSFLSVCFLCMQVLSLLPQPLLASYSTRNCLDS